MSASTARPADFAHVNAWVFDLDNTLYPPTARLFDQIEALMVGYLTRELGVDAAEAQRLRRLWWRDHGTTLAGLMIHHRIDPEPFLDEVHRIDFSALAPDPALRAAIAALPGRRIVYTNGAAPYARAALAALGLEGLFGDVYGVEHAFYTPKPEAAAFQRVFAIAGFDPRRAAMFEDDPRNLAAPARLGLATVLVSEAPPAPRPPHVHHVTDDLAGFLARIAP